MRADMAKVIVERPRSGWRLRIKRRKQHQRPERDPDATVRRESMAGSRGTKSLNEHLGPLQRYLHSQVGRPWNRVYSEISRNLRPTNAVQQHVRDHLRDFVIVETRVVAGEVIATLHGRSIPIREVPGWAPLYYVCPRSGVLRRCRREGCGKTARKRAARRADEARRRAGRWKAREAKRRGSAGHDGKRHREGWHERRRSGGSRGAAERQEQ